MVEPSLLPLVLKEACAHVRGKQLIGPVDLTISPKGFTVVMGPNGAGKTTLLRLMHGLQRLTGGSIEWAIDEAKTRRKQAYVFQTPIMMRRRVLDSIAYPLLLHGVPKQQAHKRAADCVNRFGLQKVMQNWAPSLSGGERQKLALARALIYRPEILFLDEPTANLDGRATREIEDILHQAQSEGTRIVMATHDMGQAKRMASEVVFVYDGKVHEHTQSARFFEGPKTKKAAAFIKGDIIE